VKDEDLMGASIDELVKLRKRMDEAYGPCADATATMNVAAGEGSLGEIVAFLREGAGHG
jgi:CRISPR system Cascade subunit CasC